MNVFYTVLRSCALKAVGKTLPYNSHSRRGKTQLRFWYRDEKKRTANNEDLYRTVLSYAL